MRTTLTRPLSILAPALALLCGVLPGPPLEAQRPRAAAAQRPAFKGVWEPVPFSSDVELNAVFFATPEIGWATGGNALENGVIIGTRDGGETWTVQLGDPESSERTYSQLRFVDGRVGFAVQSAASGGHRLLRTLDGERWDMVGTVPEHRRDYIFVSPTVGVVSTEKRLIRTEDAGATWRDVFLCQVKVVVNGLTRDAGCILDALHFPSPRVGYAIGYSYDAPGLFVARTEDAGKSWKAWHTLPTESGHEAHLFFTDETHGVACLTDGKYATTDDGGRTWALAPGPGCQGKPAVRFADPEVGWTLVYQAFNYSLDGGRRWTGREMAFPALVNAFSLPRRDRGFAVGPHGMVYRYRVVPASEPVAEGVLVAPAMPGFATELDEQVGALDAAVAELTEAVNAAPGTSAGDGAAAADPAGEPADADAAPLPSADLPAPSSFLASCCARPQGRLGVLLGGIVGALPQLLEKHRNTNTLGGGLLMLVELPLKVTGLRDALAAVWRAPDKATAQQALLQLSAATSALQSTTAMVVQDEPAAAFGPGAGPAGGDAAAATAAATADAAADSATAGAGDARKKVEAEAKKKLGGLIKKKVRIP